jgi:hypothetical protein
MAGGRPTDDPKETLVAVRLAERQVGTLEARARREGLTVSEALRRCIDEWAAARRPSRGRSTKRKGPGLPEGPRRRRTDELRRRRGR